MVKKRRWFEIEKSNINLDEILIYCVGKKDTLIDSNDKMLFFIKLKEGLKLPKVMDNLNEIDEKYMDTDSNWVKKTV